MPDPDLQHCSCLACNYHTVEHKKGGQIPQITANSWDYTAIANLQMLYLCQSANHKPANLYLLICKLGLSKKTYLENLLPNTDKLFFDFLVN
jgi:hypothetical protein